MGLTVLFIAVIVFCLSSSLIQVDCYSYYKSTYHNLTNGNLVFDYQYGGLYYFCNPNEKGKHKHEVIIFTNDNKTFRSVKVGPYKYIHGGLLTWVSPYTLYYHIQYRIWFEKNKERFDSLK